ncbi:MAG: hypothetical protein CMM67_09770 [Rhodospirillaceae bacterium]|nr:hypothetical protein [Rhodospirillaceae bacterium]OUT77009.1 MAG: hypothetical protein CBB83_09950 [Rhodospirillaceae bacterium TMED23]|tara:strand:- start:208 stop:630 length:423 start_codon:yes stop_codon:yes gene_type:complete
MISIQKAQILDLTKYAETEYPIECCGLLIGRFDQGNIIIEEIIPSQNIAKGDTRILFEIDPQIRINTQRRLRNSPQKIIGHFHSHPDAPPLPSPTDLNMAIETELIWAIVSVYSGIVNEVKMYGIDISGNSFNEIDYRVY